MEIAAVIGILFFLGIIIALIPLVAAAFGDTETAEEVGNEFKKCDVEEDDIDLMLHSFTGCSAERSVGNVFADHVVFKDP